MCGITGLWDMRGQLTGEACQEALQRMLACIAHRGPDADGKWCDPQQGIYLGHRRLSILDLSPLGAQPMPSPSGRYVTVFNGEIYNFRALRSELENRGVAFRGHSDTEVMLAAFEHWGIAAAIERFIGMFAIALWDVQDQALHLIRDRLGKKPLYYAQWAERLWFGSDLQSLLQAPGFQAAVNRSALTAYMRLGCVPGDHCIYEHAHKVLPGAWLTISKAGSGYQRYWSALDKAASAVPFSGSNEAALEALEGLLLDAVRLRMESDVPLGAFLSGGIDSSLVVALMQRLSSTPVQTFSIGFEEAVYDEAPYARKVAAHLGTQHTEVYVSASDALAVVSQLPRLYSEPFGDSSQIPMYLVSGVARRNVTVALSGDGGDELFSGYSRYVAGQRGWSLLRKIPPPLRSLAHRVLSAIPDPLWRRSLMLLQPWLPGRLRQFKLFNKRARLSRLLGHSSFQSFYLALLSQWEEPARLVLGGTEAEHAYLSAEPFRRLPSRLDWMSATDAAVYLPDDILVKVDRASMGVSLEARTPLLDHRVYEFAWSLPQQLKAGKRPLRALLQKYVPAELVERPKMGFAVPLDSWLRGPLKSWADDLLSPSLLQRQGYLDHTVVGSVWRAHKNGEVSEGLRLWNVLMFQSWLQYYGLSTS